MTAHSRGSSQETGQYFLRLYNRRNVTGFNEVFKLYHPDIFAFVSYILKGSPASEEIVHDTFLKVWRKKKKFRSLDKLKGYHIVVAKRKCLNYLNSPAGRTIYKELVEEDHIIDAADLLDYKLLQHRLMEKIREKKSEKKSRLFRDIFIREWSTIDVANQNGLKENAVRNEKSRFRELLRQERQEKK